MKRLIALFLCLATLLSFASCATSTIQPTQETSTQTEEAGTSGDNNASGEYPKINDPLTWEKINSFPIATDSMSIAERRALVVDFFRFAQTFPWTPDKTYEKSTVNKLAQLSQGVVYGGLPYALGGGGSSGNIYRVMEIYDEKTGIVTFSKGGSPIPFGNQCSCGAFVGWGRVVSSANYNLTHFMVQKNGFIPVGPYTYDATIDRLDGKIHTSDIVRTNGEQVMFESYAKMQPADGLVQWTVTTAGHVIMCTSEPVIVRNPDGTINGEESYVTIIDQAAAKTLETALEKADWKASFNYLLKGSFIPFTFAELIGTDPIEPAVTTFSFEGEQITIDELKAASATSNYAISDLYVTATDSSGKSITKVSRCGAAGEKTLTLNDTIYHTSFSSYAKKGATVEVVAQLYNGERPVIYSGTLIP